MQTILVANPKGGSGKTTLATNIAGWLSAKRQHAALQDLDSQRSSAQWLARRPELFPRIVAAPPSAKTRDVKESGAQWLVVDTPAGLHGEELRESIRRADVMLVPLTPSAFDMAATRHFFTAIQNYKAVKEGALALGIVAMRVDVRTHSAALLDTFLEEYDFPVIAHLRDTQVYVHCEIGRAHV